MRKFLPLLTALLLALNSNAQTIVLEQDFENGMGDWTAIDLDSLTYASQVQSYIDQHEAWTILTDGTNSFAASSSWYADGDKTASDWLISPVFKCTNSNFLTWKGKAGNASYPDGYIVMLNNITDDEVSAIKTITAEEGDWTDHQFDLSAHAGDSLQLYFIQNSTDMFWLYLDDIVVFEAADLDLELAELSMNDFAVVGSTDITGTVTNLGTTTVSSFIVKYTIDGGSEMSKTFSPALGTLEDYNFTIADAFTVASGQTHTVRVWIDQVNNTTDDVTDNNELSASVGALSALPTKRVLIEEASGAWCGWCPDGAYVLDTILTNNENAIGVTVHNGDDMTFSETDALISAYISGFPSGIVDRKLFDGESEIGIGRHLWSQYSRTSMEEIVAVEVGGTSEYNATTRELTLTAKAHFYAGMNNLDYRINAYIYEDEVTGTGSGYNQVNYLSGRTGYENNPYYSEPSSIVGYEHMKTARALLGGTWGEENVIPADVADGDTFEKTWTVTLDNGWDADKCKLVVFVQKYSSNQNARPIVNAIKMDLNDMKSVSIEEMTSANVQKISAYPNPATDFATVDFTIVNNENVTIKVMNMQGQTLKVENLGNTPVGQYSHRISTKDLEAGAYIISIETNEGRNTLPLMKN